MRMIITGVVLGIVMFIMYTTASMTKDAAEGAKKLVESRNAMIEEILKEQ